MTKYKYDVLILGDLCDNDLIFAEHLSRKGLRCCITNRKEKNNREIISKLSDYHTHFKKEDILVIKNEFCFFNLAKKCRLIVSFTGALIRALKILWPWRFFLGLPPVINITTGSDITELAAKKSLYGMLYRSYLRSADVNWCVSYPHALKNILFLKIPRVVFMRYPYYLGDIKPQGKMNQSPRVRFFHPSHLDWKVNDPGRSRTSSKGNDRFIRAFAKAIKNNLDAECVILDRGPDKEVAKALIRSLGLEDRFIWKPFLSRQELFLEFAKADVVVDQFDVGGFGGIAIEAMSVGKPIMIYLQENCLKLLYPETPPVLNCRTEDEIYKQIIKCQDKSYLQHMGKLSKKWVNKYHHWETCLDQFLFYYTLLTGHRVVDYGWERRSS